MKIDGDGNDWTFLEDLRLCQVLGRVFTRLQGRDKGKPQQQIETNPIDKSDKDSMQLNAV